MTALTDRQIDRRIIDSRRALARWAASNTEITRAQIVAEIGALEGLLVIAPPEKRAKIEALIARYLGKSN